MTTLTVLGAAGLFAVGVWLSAFFSGSETAFYRLSLLRVTVKSRGGDRAARRMLRFIATPAAFVATVLVGNNVANYLTTLSIGLGMSAVVPDRSDATEIALTILIAPVVFLFGELVPKNVNYLTPFTSLRRKMPFFRACHALFQPLSWPLVQLTGLFERVGSGGPAPVALGRPRLGDLIATGHTEGVLTDAQAQLGNALIGNGAESIAEHVVGSSTILGLPADATPEEAIAHAHKYGLSCIALHEPDAPSAWVGSVTIGALLSGLGKRKTLRDRMRPMPDVSPTTTRLEAARLIRGSGGGYAVAKEDGRPLGLVSLSAVAAPLLRSERRVLRRRADDIV